MDRQLTEEELAVVNWASLQRTKFIRSKLRMAGFRPGKPTYPGTSNPYSDLGSWGKYSRPAYPVYVLQGNKRIMPFEFRINDLLIKNGGRPAGTKTIELPIDINGFELSQVLAIYYPYNAGDNYKLLGGIDLDNRAGSLLLKPGVMEKYITTLKALTGSDRDFIWVVYNAVFGEPELGRNKEIERTLAQLPLPHGFERALMPYLQEEWQVGGPAPKRAEVRSRADIEHQAFHPVNNNPMISRAEQMRLRDLEDTITAHRDGRAAASFVVDTEAERRRIEAAQRELRIARGLITRDADDDEGPVGAGRSEGGRPKLQKTNTKTVAKKKSPKRRSGSRGSRRK